MVWNATHLFYTTRSALQRILIEGGAAITLDSDGNGLNRHTVYYQSRFVSLLNGGRVVAKVWTCFLLRLWCIIVFRKWRGDDSVKSTSNHFQLESKSKTHVRQRLVALMTLAALSGTTAIVAASENADGASLSLAGLPNGEFCLTDDECTSNFCDPVVLECACTENIHCAAGELCNTGVNPNRCTKCGNGIVNPGEFCDDGNDQNDDGCDNNCTFTGCGNGIVTTNEMCDDSNAADDDGCSATCTIETGWGCGCSVSYGAAQEAGKLGGDLGGKIDSLECYDNEVFIGLSIAWTKNAAGTAVPGSATTVEGICGAVDVDSVGTVNTYRASTPYSAELGCNGWEPVEWSDDVYCPPGQAIVGLQGTNAPMMTAFYTSVAIECQAIGGDLIPYGPKTVIPVPNPNGVFPGTSVAFSCAPGTIAKALGAQSTCGQEALILTCAVPHFDCSYVNWACSAICGDGFLVPGWEDCDDPNQMNDVCCTNGCTFQPTNVLCRPSTNVCDVAEMCTGNAATCPADDHVVDGTDCDDGNACTQADSCQSGACTGADPIECPAIDQCHEMGTCDPATGSCSQVAKPEGSSCNDGNTCTENDSCLLGVCTGVVSGVCEPMNECEQLDKCNDATGQCSFVPKPDGSPCQTNKQCQAGECVATCTTSYDCDPNPDAFACYENRCVKFAGRSSDACACRIPGASTSSGDVSGLGMLAGLALLMKRRRLTRCIRLQRPWLPKTP